MPARKRRWGAWDTIEILGPFPAAPVPCRSRPLPPSLETDIVDQFN